ncbi:acid-activated periplasmic chaperone HdeA [Budvicia aquatica]|uniref:10K-S protein n=1 Tax=Budvicia aquatica TaxID=82979 RepID=A0A2C6DKQ6_9GAMM|nr:acid-activated periplasmic chaperone HdeA [Budvicia aquatica]PHI29411.1 hypothetical protein CRN84_08745 [Budvicia aquatica]VFS47670.1 10K-S protein [Budvicia aquatica]
MNKLIILATVCLIQFIAQSAEQYKEGVKPIVQWTCEDFLLVDESFQPTAVGYAEAYNKKGTLEDSILDIDEIVKITPIIIQECAKDKQESFIQKVKSHVENLRNNFE